MKKNNIFKIVLIVVVLVFYLTACKEVNFTGKEIAWSPDGRFLAFVNLQTSKIFITEPGNAEEKVSLVDEDASSAQFLQWSDDGSYLMYLKSQDDNLGLWVYDRANRKSLFVENVAFRKVEKVQHPVSVPKWEPSGNRISVVNFTKDGYMSLVTISPKDNSRKNIFKAHCENIIADWDPRDKSLLFSVRGDIDSKNNGIWLMNFEKVNPDQICRQEGISEFVVSPQSARIAFSVDGNADNSNLSKVFVLNNSSEKPVEIFETEQTIEKIDWALDGENLACVVSGDEIRNIFLVDITKRKSRKLTFDNVVQYFGWDNPHKLYFTIRYPETLVELSGIQEDEKEFNEIIKGKATEYQLVYFDGKNFKKVEKDIALFRQNPVTDAAAYYKISKVGFFDDELFLAAIKKASGEITFFPESSEESLAAADACLAMGKYENALRYLSHYWEADFRKDDIKELLKSDEVFDSEKPDSVRLEKLKEALMQGAFARTIIALQKSGLDDRATDFIDGFARFSSQYFEKTKENYDELTWSIIIPYSRIQENKSGISMLDRFLQSAPFDSQATSYLLFAQAIFSYEDGNCSACIEKLKQSQYLLPSKNNEVKPYNALLSFCLKNTGFKRKGEIDELFELLTHRFRNGKGIEMTYELMGDYFEKNGEKTKALKAYQKSLYYNPNDSRIWGKIFNLEN